jgi:hypothetical protein
MTLIRACERRGVAWLSGLIHHFAVHMLSLVASYPL